MPSMATANYEYNEVTNTTGPVGGEGDVNGLDPMYHYDTHFPERMSRLHMAPEFPSPSARRSKGRMRNRNAARFKTQPITFDEIQEVDEEAAPSVSVNIFEKTMEGLKYQFTAFSRSMDGILPSLGGEGGEGGDIRPVPSPLALPTNQQTDAGHTGSSAPDRKEKTESAHIETEGGIRLPPGLPMDDTHSRTRRRQKFRNRKHNRSIEEAPELDK